MNRRLFLALAVSAAPAAALAQDHPSYSGGPMPEHGDIDPKNDPRVQSVTSGLACNCGTCPHEPVSTCTCGTAARLRAEVASFIFQGKTPEEARAAMIEKHGYEIVPKPPFAGLNLIAWIGPFVLIGIVAGLVAMMLLKWKAKAAETAQSAPPPAGGSGDAAAADPYLSQVERELEKRA